MGNSASEVNDSLKAQAGGEGGPELYKYVNVSGTGQLISLMKTADVTKDFAEIDDIIKNIVSKYLYNDGRGQDVPISDIVLRRTNGKVPTAVPEIKDTVTTKFTGLKIESSGAVGESLLHLCMLNGTDIHIKVAKRLLLWYPCQINDIYMGEDYYGENALHMGIVAENPSLVKYLLVCGADVHQRCTGKFFTCDDQKPKRVDHLENEHPSLPVNTNYKGYSYFGEYPLSFAAILNQEECIRLLIAKDANPNLQDSNGNTVLHMLVINDNLKMFQLMLTFRAKLEIKNCQGLTPLTLAAKLARKEMFQFILMQQRKLIWKYADITCGAYPLDTVDTIAEDGNTDTTSALYLVCNGESVEHLELLEGLVVDLLNIKWQSFVKNNFYIECALWFMYFLLSTIVLILKRLAFDDLELIGCLDITDSFTHLIDNDKCKCAYLYPEDEYRHGLLVMEIFMYIYSAVYLVIFGYELYIQKVALYSKSLLLNPSKVLFIISVILTLLIIPLRVSCSVDGEDYLMIISIIFKSFYVLYLGRGFKRITTFVYIIHEVIKTQFFNFCLIFSIFALGFSQAFYVGCEFGNPLGGYDWTNRGEQLFTTPFESFFLVNVMLLNDLGNQYVYMHQSYYEVIILILLFIFIIIHGILLINLLIAMMSNTYDRTTELDREWLRQWAMQVLTIEQNVGIKYRLKAQKKYATIIAEKNSESGRKVFMARWRQTEKERAEIKSQKQFIQDQIKKMDDDLSVKSL